MPESSLRTQGTESRRAGETRVSHISGSPVLNLSGSFPMESVRRAFVLNHASILCDDSARQRTGLAAADTLAVDRNKGRHLAHRSCQKCLFRLVQIPKAE